MPTDYQTLALGAGVILVAYLAIAYRRKTVYEHQQALLYKKGLLEKILPPGIYWYNRLTTSHQVMDMRSLWLTIPGQEILTKDNAPVKISLVANYRITDPLKAAALQSYQEDLYILLQLALREHVSQLTLEELLQERTLTDGLIEAINLRLAEAGLTLLDIRAKDIMLSGELKKAYGEILKAKQQGLAALERARGETAALRNLANAAKLLEDNPLLFKLRLLQSAADRGNSVVISTEKE
jgi:regulator of protease activity HflC (stomatin/prohibitin superfamily)